MRVEPNETYAGVLAVRVRDLFRKAGLSGPVDPDFVRHVLGLTGSAADGLLRHLAEKGFITPVGEHANRWRITCDGNALYYATAAKPVRRRVAEEILERMLQRVEQVRRDPAYLVRVETIVLFGSMTTEKPTVSDIDLGIQYVRKEPDEARFDELRKAHWKSAMTAGRRFNTVEQWHGWPIEQVRLFLKSKVRSLSLHPLADWICEQPGARYLFLHHDDDPRQQTLFETNGL